MIPGDLLSAFPHRQFHTLPGLLDSWAALPNSYPNACMPMQGGSLYHFYDCLWYDPAERRTHDLPCERGTRYRLSQPDTVQIFVVHCIGYMYVAAVSFYLHLDDYFSPGSMIMCTVFCKHNILCIFITCISIPIPMNLLDVFRVVSKPRQHHWNIIEINNKLEVFGQILKNDVKFRNILGLSC